MNEKRLKQSDVLLKIVDALHIDKHTAHRALLHMSQKDFDELSTQMIKWSNNIVSYYNKDQDIETN